MRRRTFCSNRFGAIPVRRLSPAPIYALRRGDDPLIVALAADHVVTDPLAFAKVCAQAGEAAQEDRIVMFGVEPTRAATEYGYIRPGPSLAPGLFAIERFVEKPDAETAARYVADGYVWNSGNFVFRAAFLLEEYRRFEPESAAAVEAAIEGAGADHRLRHARARGFRARHRQIDRLRGDGAHRAGGGHAGVLRLVGRGLLAGRLGIVGARCRRQCRARHRRLC